MFNLRDLIIERLDELKTLSNKISLAIPKQGIVFSFDQELEAHHQILKLLSVLKKKEKQRILSQKQYLEEIKTLRFANRKVLEDFYAVSQTIFSRSDSAFTIPIIETNMPISQKIHTIFCLFFEQEHDKLSPSQVMQIIKGEISEINPFILMGWICQWSSTQLNNSLKALMKEEFDRHQEEIKKMGAARGNLMLDIKQRLVNPLSMSTHVRKSSQTISTLVLVNKEEVYGLFLDELAQYYKLLPLQLDGSYLKSIKRKNRKNQFQRVQNWQKVVFNLIQFKNKCAKEQISQYKQEYQDKFPQFVFRNENESKIDLFHSPSKTEKKYKKPVICNDRIIERIKSQSKEDKVDKKDRFNSKNSLLLCPKPNEIKFRSSKEILHKLNRDRQRQLQLPDIMLNRYGGNQFKTASKGKPVNNGFMDWQEKGQKSRGQGSPKIEETKQSHWIQKLLKRNNDSYSHEVKLQLFDNPEFQKINGQKTRRHRKLMLQCLREKNKPIFADK